MSAAYRRGQETHWAAKATAMSIEFADTKSMANGQSLSSITTVCCCCCKRNVGRIFTLHEVKQVNEMGQKVRIFLIFGILECKYLTFSLP